MLNVREERIIALEAELDQMEQRRRAIVQEMLCHSNPKAARIKALLLAKVRGDRS